MSISEILLEKGLLNQSQIDEAIALQRAEGLRLDHALVQLGLISERQLLEMQSTGRFVTEMLGREVRKAGYRANRERSLADIFPAAGSPFGAAGSPDNHGLVITGRGD